MSDLPPPPAPPLRWRMLARLAMLCAAAALAFALAHWGWRWFGPGPVRVAPAEPSDVAASVAAAGLFGTPGSIAAPAPAAGPPAALTGETRLLGIFAETGGKGYALFRIAGRGPRLVATGQEVAPDVTLMSVRPDGITVRDRGVERAIELRAEASRSKAAPAGPVLGGPARVATAACVRPPGFEGQVVRLNAELLSGLVAQPESWKALVEPSGGALVVRDESGFVAMLGLRRGDRLEQANGIALATVDDVVRAVLKPLAATPSQSVRLTGVRDGSKRELLLLNAGACPS